jgi:hypothetical protein
MKMFLLEYIETFTNVYHNVKKTIK